MSESKEFMSSYQPIFDRMNELGSQYGDLPVESLMRAYGNLNGANLMNPFIQNRRVKAIGTLPQNLTKDQVAEMIVSPYGNEQPLRAVSHSLEFTAYPYFKMRKTYQDLLTYHHYAYPAYVDENDAKSPEFLREWRLVDKLIQSANLKTVAHTLVGKAVQEGKVFYTARYKVDKPHNQVNYAFLQQLPSDWCKIVGMNNVSGYTVAFNMFYFLQPGAVWNMYGDLFEPYLDDFSRVIEAKPRSKVVYGAKGPVNRHGIPMHVNLDAYNELCEEKRMNGSAVPDMFEQNGKWFYWAVLPPEKVWTFEVDDCNPAVITPLTGLFLSMTQIAQYESLQFELLQNPLVALLTGEIPYYDGASANAQDAYKMSPSGRKLFDAYFYQLMNAYNTGGIGWYTAPVENIKMHQLAEAPNAEKISSSGYAYTVLKSGMGAILPTTTEPRAGLAQISLQIESRYAQGIYRQIERMMNWILSDLNLKWEWRFRMFGSLATDESDKKAAKEGMTLGILTDTLRYAALNDYSLLDDLSISNSVLGLGILDKRLPLISSYSAKQGTGLPPSIQGASGGRPESENVTSDGNEQDADEGEIQ